MKGNLFEQLVRQYLLNDAQMRLEFRDVYLWKDWSGNKNLPDTGIDLVGILQSNDGDDDVVAIQCKFYNPSHRIQKSDIDSFLSESGKHPYVGRIVVETTGEEWSPNARNAIEDQQIPVSTIGLTDLRNSDIDWSTYRLEVPLPIGLIRAAYDLSQGQETPSSLANKRYCRATSQTFFKRLR